MKKLVLKLKKDIYGESKSNRKYKVRENERETHKLKELELEGYIECEG
jgi:hypothetical protein